MRYLLSISIIFTALILFSGCNKCDPTNDLNGIIVEDAIVRVIDATVAGPQFINSASEYNAEIEVSFDEGLTYQPVDFTEYTVFALPTTASCSSGYSRDVSANDPNETVTYSIIITECDYCEGTTSIPNWVITTKVPASYTPIYEVD
jgi:hypothetical protein